MMAMLLGIKLNEGIGLVNCFVFDVFSCVNE